MNHVEAHNKMSTMLEKLERGQVKPQFAKEVFNGYGKLMANTKNELAAINMGFPVEVPMLGIKQIDAEELMQMTKGKSTARLK